MLGYWRQPEATAATLTADGWLRTGDLGYLDDDGDLYITGRRREMIKSGAHRIAPAEVEEAAQAAAVFKGAYCSTIIGNVSFNLLEKLRV